MNLQWRAVRPNWRYLVWAIVIGLVLLEGLLAYADKRLSFDPVKATITVNGLHAAVSKNHSVSSMTSDNVAAPAPAALHQVSRDSKVLGAGVQAAATEVGVYTGPGTVAAHTNFEQWLGRSAPYATDYIDYKGGWQKDFIDSRLWLSEPWGKWVSLDKQRRLVLGLPMLESENSGQFEQGARGDFDNYFRYLATNLVANNLGNSIIRLGYEANTDTIGPWQATDNPAAYKQLFRHIVGVMRSTPGSTFVFDWTVCNGLQDGRKLDSFASFYPGDDVVDIMGMDLYDVKWMDPAATPQQRWDYATSRPMGVSEWLQFAKDHHKPVSYPEWGLYKPGDNFAGGGDDPYFVTKMSGLFAGTHPVYQSYFDLDWGGGVLSDFPQGAAAFKQLFSGS